MADSLETKAIVKYMVDSGTPHIRSSFFCQGHSSSGYHCLPGTGAVGTACDFQDLAPRDKPGLLAIFNTFLLVETQLAELIYSGAPFNIKNGVRVPRYSIDGHWLHVHSAVKRGVFIKWPSMFVVIVKTEEVDMQVSYVNVTIPTDSVGNGWVTVPYHIDTILSHIPPGLRPGVDHRYESAEVGFAQEDSNTIVSVVGWAPTTTALVRLRVAV